MARIPRNSVSLAGEFAVLSQLMVRGYVASMTLGNTKAVDILVLDPVTNHSYQIEVKTNFQNRNGPTNSKLWGKFISDWQMNVKHEQIENPDLFYCFVHINSLRTDLTKHAFRFFVVPSVVVANYVKSEHQAFLNEKPNRKANDRRTFRIGLPNDRSVAAPAPLASDYEDKWELVASPSVLITPDDESEPS